MAPPADARFRPGRLVSSESVGGGLQLLAIDPGPQITKTYQSPGQYIEVRVGGETGYFVLAAEPGQSPWNLVTKSGGGASDVLLKMPAGGPVEVTEAIGPGFPMAAARGRPLVVALAGTGIAAARPLMRPRVRDGEAGRTTLLVRLRQLDESALEGDIDGWAGAGVHVRVCVSQGHLADRGDRFVRGRIPDALQALAVSHPGSVASALVFSVGARSLFEALRQSALDVGIAASDVLTNH